VIMKPLKAKATWNIMQNLFDDETLKKFLVKINKKGQSTGCPSYDRHGMTWLYFLNE
jgi:hypothetical protein